MKHAAILALGFVLCVSNPSWSKMNYQPQCNETLFDVLLDIVTAPCALLATCVGLDANSRCVPPATVKQVTPVKKCIQPSPPVVRTEKTSSKTALEKTEPDVPRKSDPIAAPHAEKPVAIAPVPIEQFTSSEKYVAQPLPRVAPQPPEPAQERPPFEQATSTSAGVTAPAPQSASRPTPEIPEKPVAEVVQPRTGTVVETMQDPPKPQLSPMKVEQKSTESVREQADSPKAAPTEAKKSYQGNRCYPAVPYYQSYPSCRPRFFSR
jgi:hypothetical protein